ncbi:MAG: ATP-binding protein [Anaerotardibacter sp.]
MPKLFHHKKRLSKSLFVALFGLSLSVFLITAFSLVCVSWIAYETDAEQRLASQSEVSANSLFGKTEAAMIEEVSNLALADMRVTLIDQEGEVLYDNVVDVSALGTHANREEVLAAKSEKNAVVLRKSETTGTDTLYAATLIDERGYVLRLSETRTSLPFYLGNLIMPLALIVVLVIAFSFVLAKLTTRKVLAPLLSINLENPLQSETYVEAEPLLNRVAVQHSQLLEQNEQLEQAVNARREFTGNVSHEMKSPLHVIGGYAEIIESGVSSPEETRKFAGLIKSESQAMRRLIDDVLMLSRLDEGAQKDFSFINLPGVCKSVIERLEQSAQDREVSLVFTSSSEEGFDKPIRMLGSETLLEQIAYNLIDNAIRYGSFAGQVLIEVKTTAKTIVLEVSDDGPGIEPAHRERVFERFYRVDPSRSRETGGTGLGLAIAKHAAETMDGCIRVEDSPLGGAKFVVTFPRKEEE